RELERVADQVLEHRLQLHPVGQDGRAADAVLPVEGHGGRHERVELAAELGEERVQVDRRALDRLAAGLEAAQVEGRVHQVEELEGASPHALDRVALVGGGRNEGALGEKV